MRSCTNIVDDKDILNQYEYDAWGNVTSEILASSSDYNKTYYNYANDEMRSCTNIVDDKDILNQYEYDAWGNVTSQKETVKNRFKFNGQYSPVGQMQSIWVLR